MIDMTTWIDLEIDVVDDLHLDPRNVRLETPEGVPESDLIQDLFSNEKAIDLVNGIAKVGWLTHEVPIVVERDGKYVVVEGNRRVAALKAVQNPYLAPEYQARISKLTQSIPSLEALRKIPVKVAPSQDEADQVIAALHTGNQRFAWTPSRQAAFFQAQIDGGKTTEQLLAQYPLIDVMKFVTRSRILELFRGVDYRDAGLKDYVKHRRRFPVSTLARLYDNDKFLDLAGIQVDEQRGTVALSTSVGVFREIAEKIVADMNEKTINTRVLNSTKSDSYKQYMSDLRETLDRALEEEAERERRRDNALKPPTNSGSAGSPGGAQASTGGGAQQSNTGHASQTGQSSGSHTSPSGTGSSSQATTSAKAQPSKPKSKYLAVENIVVASNRPVAIHAIRQEVGALNVERFPNATLDLLRTFLEKSIKAYADSLGIDIRKETNVKGFVYLSHSLQWLEHHFKGDPKRKSLIQVIQKIRANKVSAFAATSDHLNAVNHNHNIVASPTDVREAWDIMASLIEAIVK